jgi:hypothetical protein
MMPSINIYSERKLGKVEEYLVAMSKVPKAEQRLQALSSYLSNQDALSSIQTSAEAILRAVSEVRYIMLTYCWSAIMKTTDVYLSRYEGAQGSSICSIRSWRWGMCLLRSLRSKFRQRMLPVASSNENFFVVSGSP